MNTINLTKVLFFFTILILFNSCNEDHHEPQQIESNINTGNEASNHEIKRLQKVLSTETLTTNFSIVVLDENDKPIPNAFIKIGTENTITNNNGFAILENVKVNKQYQLIETTNSGYTPSLKTVTPSKNGLTNVAITLLKPSFEKSFSAKNGGTVANEKVAIDFPADAIADQEGNLYNGEVTTTVTYYDPNSNNFSSTIPGTLVGLDDANSLQALISKGMIKVDLTDTSGNELEIFEGKEATITLPATTNDPDNIDLWHLNEEKGIWVQTGTATKKDNKYIVNVTHFSTYNLDVKVAPINITFILKDTKGKLLTNFKAKLELISNVGNYKGIITTDNKGEFVLIRAPKGADYKISKSICEKNILTPIGVINDSTTKEVIIDMPSVRNITIKGTLEGCDNKMLINKIFVIDVYNGTTIDRINAFSDTEGNYSVNSILCNYDTTSKYKAEIRIHDGANDIVKENEFTFNEDNLLKNIIVCNGTIETAGERIYDGDLFITSDQKLQDFITSGYTKVTGDLTVKNITSVDLSGLQKLTYVGGKLTIENTMTKDLVSLKNLSFIGTGLFLQDNKSLTSLKGLDNLTTDISKHNLFGFSLSIVKNPNLVKFDVKFDKLENLGIINIGANDKLISVDGFEKVSAQSDPFIAYVRGNKSLTNITFLNISKYFTQLTITENPKLENLLGIENATVIENIQIVNNDNLTNFCAINQTTASTIGGFELDGNAFNPTKQNLINGICSQ